MIKLTCLLKRREGMTPAEFQEYWRDNHGPLVASTSAAATSSATSSTPGPSTTTGTTTTGRITTASPCSGSPPWTSTTPT